MRDEINACAAVVHVQKNKNNSQIKRYFAVKAIKGCI